jgi:hypothetical protein
MSDPTVQTRAPDAQASTLDHSKKSAPKTKRRPKRALFWFGILFGIGTIAFIVVAALPSTGRAQTPLEVTATSIILSALSTGAGALISIYLTKSTNESHQDELKALDLAMRASEESARRDIAVHSAKQLMTLVRGIAIIQEKANSCNRADIKIKDYLVATREIESIALIAGEQGVDSIHAWKAIAPEAIDAELASVREQQAQTTIIEPTKGSEDKE